MTGRYLAGLRRSLQTPLHRMMAVALIAGALAIILWRIGGKAPAEDGEFFPIDGDS